MKRPPTLSKIVIAALLAAMLISGCEKEIDPGTLPEQNPRLVVNSLLTNEYFMNAHISVSRSILDNKPFKLVEDAVCDVYENGVFKKRLAHVDQGYYGGDFIPVTGREYAIRVSAPGFSEAEASTRIPPLAHIAGVNVSDTAQSQISYNHDGGFFSFYYGGTVQVALRLLDDPNQENFYGLTPYFIIKDENGVKVDSVSAFPGIPDSGELFEEIEYLDHGMLAVNDEILVNGNEIHVQMAVQVGESRNFGIRFPKTYELWFMVVHLTPEAYKYRSATMKQQGSPAFFSEPVIIPGNIKNGLGIFGGASISYRLVLTGNLRQM